MTRTGFSMKTLIAAYSGVLRGEQRAQAARSESSNGRSVVSCEGSGRWGEGLGDDLSPPRGLQGLVGFLPGVMKLQVFQERL